MGNPAASELRDEGGRQKGGVEAKPEQEKKLIKLRINFLCELGKRRGHSSSDLRNVDTDRLIDRNDMNNTWSAAPLPPVPPLLPPPPLLPLPPRPPLPLPRRRRPPLLPPSGQAPPSSVSCPPCRGPGAPGAGGTRATSRRGGPAARGGRRRGEGAAAGAEEEAGWREGCPSRESILRPPPPPRPLSRSPRHPARQTIRRNKQKLLSIRQHGHERQWHLPCLP